jgi:hypothetical protein
MFEKLGSYLIKIKCAPNVEQVGCSLQGVLAQAKNGDQVFWEEKFHAANGKAQACTQGALPFSLLCFGGGGEVFCHFYRLPNVFTVCSLQVPMIFPNFAIFPQHVFHSTSLLSQYDLEKWCPPFTYIGGPKGRNYILENGAFCFGESS